MTAYLKTMLSKLRRDERGVTLVEYGIAIALAVGVGTAALTALSGDITTAMGVAGAAMPN
ncbi:hypothetical protein KUV26_08820 [Leisingera daeponensis]|uniref:Flp family type IVb pilin n=1 Tax=Leisingera daeponensis TaxID=405746 RepID=A0ABS7NEA5_9RHOB|nr:hypothetical protein [Leisingera daeponensis]MBY6139532.1 hypothetical protein [Leisingera daeponensis]